jgi:glycosyltransferase involved in cell wall biosynthesis
MSKEVGIKKRKVAIIHDFLADYGGAEKVLEILCEIFPQAPIFTLLHNQESSSRWANQALLKREIHTSFLQRMPAFLKKRKRWLLPLMPTAPETFNLREFDLVLSSSSGFAKGVIVKSKTIHVSYVHAPMRYIWDWQHEYLEEQHLKGKLKLSTRLLLNYLRVWDRASAERPDYLIANSQFTARRIEKYYRRSAPVIYPPVEVEKFTSQKEHQGYFLTVARLSAYKRIDLIIDAFAKLKLSLVIVGTGKEEERLKKRIKQRQAEHIKMKGWVPEKELLALYQNARAFVFAAEEDFGIAPIEAMAAGKPVIALRAGGTAETVIAGETGEFFEVPQVEMVADGIRRFIKNEKKYHPTVIRRQAEKFSRQRFKNEIKRFLEQLK